MNAIDPPPPFRRGAPAPLAAYLSALLWDVQQGGALAEALDDQRFPWRPSLRGAAGSLAGARDDVGREAFAAAVWEEGAASLRSALAGVRAYQDAPRLRPPRRPPEEPLGADPEAAGKPAGGAVLRDYAAVGAPETGAPLLALPSLLNSSRILDLTRARSLLRGLGARGCRPFLLSWGGLGPRERQFDVAAYLRAAALPALERASERAGRPVALLGHCMAGPMALALAQAAPERVSSIALLAAPWDFRPLAPPPAATPARRDLEGLLAACGAVFGGVPPEVMNALFFLRDPLQAARKFHRFTPAARRRAAGRLFVAVEDWLNDGRRLPAPAAQDLLVRWGLDDAPRRGLWRPLGEAVRPNASGRPLLVISSPRDTVTPEPSAAALLSAAPRAARLRPSGGHVGMLVGSRAEAELWRPLADWLRAAAA